MEGGIGVWFSRSCAYHEPVPTSLPGTYNSVSHIYNVNSYSCISVVLWWYTTTKTIGTNPATNRQGGPKELCHTKNRKKTKILLTTILLATIQPVLLQTALAETREEHVPSNYVRVTRTSDEIIVRIKADKIGYIRQLETENHNLKILNQKLQAEKGVYLWGHTYTQRDLKLLLVTILALVAIIIFLLALSRKRTVWTEAEPVQPFTTRGWDFVVGLKPPHRAKYARLHEYWY